MVFALMCSNFGFISGLKVMLKKQFLFIIVALVNTSICLAQSDAVSVFNQTSDEINCASVKVLLSSYGKNINNLDCNHCKFETLLEKIPFAKTKALAAQINGKKEAMASGINAGNLEKNLQALGDFAVETTLDKSASQAIINAKKSKAQKAVKSLIDNALVLVAPASNSATAETNSNQAPDVAETSDNNDIQLSEDELLMTPLDGEQTIQDKSEMMMWMAIATGLVAIAIIILSLFTMARMRKDIAEFKTHYFHKEDVNFKMNQLEQRILEKIKLLEQEEKRLSDRQIEFEDYIIELRNKI